MKKGFTILELIVVVAIIGILTAITLAFYSEVRQKSRDARRDSEVHSIKNALAIYSTSKGKFPSAISATVLDGTDSVSTDLLDARAIGTMPTDPIGKDEFVYTYISQNEASTYILTYCYESKPICKEVTP